MIRVLFGLLLLHNVVCVVGMQTKKTEIRPFFEIFAHMNSLDILSDDKHKIADFGEKVGYLLHYPLTCWKAPVTDKEKDITVQWVKKLYAEKSESILEPMIEQLLAKMVQHQEWHDFIMEALLDEEDKDLIIDLRFKELDYKQQQDIEKKQKPWVRCTIL